METNPTVVFTSIGNIELMDKPIPKMKSDNVLIETLVSQISIGTEMAILLKENVPTGSSWDIYGTYPFNAGYTNIGKVVDVGDEIDKSWIGKTVCNYGLHSRYNVTDLAHIYKIPEGIDHDQALFFTMSEVAMNGIRRAKVSWGDKIVIYGAGIIGQLVARYCSLAGADCVIVVDVSNYRLSKLENIKNIITVNSQEQDVVPIVQEHTKNRMADIVFEVTGFAALIPEEIKALKRLGKFIILSSPKGKTLFDFHDLCNGPSIKIIGAHNFSHPLVEEEENQWTKARDAEFFFDLITKKSLDLSNLVTHRVPYFRAVEMYKMLINNRKEILGIHLYWTDENQRKVGA